MKLENDCIIKLDKGTRKVKCFKFKSKLIKRELALHEDADNKNYASISDVKTGLRLFGFPKKPESVTAAEINEKLDTFVRHFTLESIEAEFKRLEELNRDSK